MVIPLYVPKHSHDRDSLADEALIGMAEVYLGQQSQIFESHGQKILKHIRVMEESNCSKWLPKVRNELNHKKEIFVMGQPSLK